MDDSDSRYDEQVEKFLFLPETLDTNASVTVDTNSSPSVTFDMNVST